VSRAALDRLGTVWCPERRAWAFPMTNAAGVIVGARLRTADGSKFALPGSHSGLFVPQGLKPRVQLLVCEGPTDTAAALTLGFQAIGRPSCTGGTHAVAAVIASLRPSEVVIVADSDGAPGTRPRELRDDPGRYGAQQLAGYLAGHGRAVKVITPAPHKDLREWVGAGATHAIVSARIRAALFWRRDEWRK
jgi:phage/plasmid primase-like uncharacterized protein